MGAVFDHASRAYRRHRTLTGRIAVALLATAAGLVIVGGSIRLLRDAGREPPRASPSGVATFDWSASLAAPVTGLAIDDNRLYVSGDAITVFPVSCVADAGRCAPRWSNETAGATGPWSAPLVSEGRVFAGSADGRLLAYPDTCSAEGCAPDWIGEAGVGPVSQPVANFDFVYVSSDALYAFPVGCATEGLACPPAWSAQVPGRPSAGPVALGDGLVIVSSSGRRSGLSAFPAVMRSGVRARVDHPIRRPGDGAGGRRRSRVHGGPGAVARVLDLVLGPMRPAMARPLRHRSGGSGVREPSACRPAGGRR